jgi:hypothetical protein
MIRDGLVEAPWTDEQVEKLNHYQRLGYVHEYTCPHDHPGRVLHATCNGWVCPLCDYTQPWAHESSLRPPPDPIATLRKLSGEK